MACGSAGGRAVSEWYAANQIIRPESTPSSFARRRLGEPCRAIDMETGMGHPIAEIYRRGFGLVVALPWLLAMPAAAEFAQHGAEILLGMYGPGGMPSGGETVRLKFGIVKIVSIFVVLLVALRWWRFDGDMHRAIRPTWAMARGLAIVLTVQLGGEALTLLTGTELAAMVGAFGPRARFATLITPLLVWLFAAGLLFPWYVGLLTEDRTMGLRRSVRATRSQLPAVFGCLLGGVLPLMIAHYAIGYGSMGRAVPLVWSLMAIDAAIVALLAAMLAASYFTIYRRAAERQPF